MNYRVLRLPGGLVECFTQKSGVSDRGCVCVPVLF